MTRKLMVLAAAMAVIAAGALAAGCKNKGEDPGNPAPQTATLSADDKKPAAIMEGPRLEKAVFAGGRFWSLVPPFEKVAGVKQVVSGYVGCHDKEPTWDNVETGKTGCLEAVMVVFDPRRLDYKELLEIYWRQIDPTDDYGQFEDRGDQYRSAIYYTSYNQQQLAMASRAYVEQSGKFDQPVVTMVLPLLRFSPAEQYQQDYHEKHPEEYRKYVEASGRGPFLDKLWAKDHRKIMAAGEHGALDEAPPADGGTPD